MSSDWPVANGFLWGPWLAIALFVGCSPRTSGRPETANVHGRVTYLGKPVAGATVTFARAGAPRFSSGRTGDDGRFELTTFTPGDGAVVGENSVTVVKRRFAGGATSAVDPAAQDNAAMDAAFDRAATTATPRSEIPLRYADRNKSGLKQNVEQGDNEFEIELTD